MKSTELVTAELPKLDSTGWAISKGQNFVKPEEKKSVSEKEKPFSSVPENAERKFTSKNGIY